VAPAIASGDEVICVIADATFSNVYGFTFTHGVGGDEFTIPVTSASGSYTSTDIFSLYTDGNQVFFYQNAVLVGSPATLNTADPYRLLSGASTVSEGQSYTFTNVRFYPTGKLGQAGDTGPAGPDSYTPANAGWWDTSPPTSMTDAIDRLAYYVFTLTEVGVPLLP
jgi:hypothetical protein